MHRYIANRVVQLIPVVFLVSVLVFSLLHLAPGDPIRMMSDRMTTQEDIEKLRQRLGLERPLPVQYWRWISGVLQGDLGKSLRSGLAVSEEVGLRWPNTLLLSVSSTLVAVAVGIPVGVVAALRRGSMLDSLTMGAAVLGLSVPAFWLGLLLMLVFAVYVPLFPAGGGNSLRHLVLPTLSLGAAAMALIARMTRSSMLEVLGQDYVRTARSKGLPERIVVYRHGLKNALIPTVTIVGLQFGVLMAGAVVTETVFSWPGVGWMMVQAILNRDFPIVQGALLVTSVTFVAVNLLVDVAYALIDPRVRYE